MLALLVDGLNLIRRVHAGVPKDEDEAEHQNGVIFALERSLNRVLVENEPTHAAVVFDGAGPSWRSRLHPPYKANRPPMPVDLVAMFPRIDRLLDDLGLPRLSIPGFEADDVIASMATSIASRGGAVLVISTDRGFAQLANERIRIRDHFGSLDLDERMTRARYGVPPTLLTSVLALVGKAPDGIPGVPGVGPKTASAWVSEFGSLESMLEESGRLPEKAAKLLGQHHDIALLSLRLVSLDTSVEVGANLRELRWRRDSR